MRASSASPYSGGIDEVVTDGHSGYLPQDPTPPGLAAALERSIKDRERWHEVAGEARRVITDECSVANTTGHLLDFLSECTVRHLIAHPAERPTPSPGGEVAIPQSITTSWRREEGWLAFRAVADGMCGANLLVEAKGSLVATLSAAVRPDLALRRVTGDADAGEITRLRWAPIEDGSGHHFILRLKIASAGTGSAVRPRITLREVVHAGTDPARIQTFPGL